MLSKTLLDRVLNAYAVYRSTEKKKMEPWELQPEPETPIYPTYGVTPNPPTDGEPPPTPSS